ncbi:MAG: hypothetical protein QXY74_04960, partial [Candidatus Bathyarchaeia archaeon]
DAGGVPSIEELAKSKFLLANPNGVCVAPPGLGILEQIEKELRKDTAKLQLAELCETIPIIIVENLQLAKEAEMKIEDNSVNLKISDSVYKSLYIDENLKSVYLLGCPIASAVACALAKASGKAVTIQKVNASIDGQTVEIRYRMVES